MTIEDIVMMPKGVVVGREIVRASFDEWLTHVFDHELGSKHWRWDEAFIEWAVLASETVGFLTKTFEESQALLKQFSDQQVAEGLEYISSGSLSEIGRTLLDESVPWTLRQRAIRSFKILYSECFDYRCLPILSHLNESIEPRLNTVCYMWWDVLLITARPKQPNAKEMDSECLAVMEFALQLESDACRESALHGLGHWTHDYPEYVQGVVDRFIKSNPEAKPELIAYAMAARKGNIQ